MRRVAVGAVVICALARPALAQEFRYVEAGGELEYAVVAAPALAEEIGALAVTGLARLRGQPAAAAEDVAAPELAWRVAPAPFGADRDRPACATLLGGDARERVAALHVRRKFRVGREAARLEVLALRVRYRDGLIARVNGVEVARRNVSPTAAPDAFAQRPHGPEWETIYVNVTPGLVREGHNEVHVEVRPGPLRSAPLVDLEVLGGNQPHLTRGPIVQQVAPGRAVVVFETDVPAYAEVWWGAGAAPSEPAYDHYVRSPAGRATRHVVPLEGLPADAEVRYLVMTAKDRSDPASFHTPPAAGDVVRFAVYGDVRTGHDTHASVLRAVAGEAPDFVVSTGDMVLRGSDEADWQRFFAVAGAFLARLPVYPVLGNHDLAGGDQPRRLEDIFALWPGPEGRPAGATWYSFDVGDVHVAVLDSHRYDDASQRAWLDDDLARAKARGARLFAATHHGPYSHGPHGGHKVGVREIVPILERHGVLVVFSGHDHLYERGRVGRLTYVVTGGGGAPLYKPRCGVPGKRRCAGGDGLQALAVEYHYVMVAVYRDFVELCARRPDGTALEECVRLP